eukprot:symbB.v1.2.008944.t1/scaffold563.1/size187063/21
MKTVLGWTRNDRFESVTFSLFVNGFAFSTLDGREASVSLSPFSLIRNCRFQSGECARLKSFKVSLQEPDPCCYFAVRSTQDREAEEERSEWVLGLSHTILLIIDSLLPMAEMSCDPVPGVPKTFRRLLAGYLIHRDDPDALSVVYCELQAPVGPRASLVIYENEACSSPIMEIPIFESSVCCDVVGINCSCFVVEGHHFASQSSSERKLWLRALSNLKVKLQNKAPEPTQDELLHFRSAIRENINTLLATQEPRIARDPLLRLLEKPSRASPFRDSRMQQAASNGDQDLPEAPGEDEVGQKMSNGDSQAQNKPISQIDTLKVSTVAMADWDHVTFAQKFSQYKADKDYKQLKHLLSQVAKDNYARRETFGRIPRTIPVSHAETLRCKPHKDSVPIISFSKMDTADACFYFAKQRRRVCALNFANGKDVGGGYMMGATAQEEDLCRQIPLLYSSLNNAQKHDLYPFGPPTCSSADKPEKYCDVLYTNNLLLARGGAEEGFRILKPREQVAVSLIAAAAPNIKFSKDVNDEKLIYRTMKTIFNAPHVAEPGAIDTLILGAWGCGAFGGDPVQIARLFVQALLAEGLGQGYKEVHFAIPQFSVEDQNYDVFRDVFRRSIPDVKDYDS